jgi:hypothetical protein
MTSQNYDRVTPQEPGDAIKEIFKLNPIIMISNYPTGMFGANNGSITAYFKYDETTFLYEGLNKGDIISECPKYTTGIMVNGDFSNYSLYLDSKKGEWNILNDIYIILAKNQCYYVHPGKKGSCNGDITKTNKSWTGVYYKRSQSINMNINYLCGRFIQKSETPYSNNMLNEEPSQYYDRVTPQEPGDAIKEIFKLNPIIMIDSYPENMFGANNKSITAYFKYDETSGRYKGLNKGFNKGDIISECPKYTTGIMVNGDFSNYSLYLDSKKGEWNILQKDNDIYIILAKNQCNSWSSSGKCSGDISNTTGNWTGVYYKRTKSINLRFNYLCGRFIQKSSSETSQTITPKFPTSSLAETFNENNIIMLTSAPENIFDNKQLPAYFKYNPITFIYEGMKTGNVECTSNSSANSISDFSEYSLYLDSDKKEWNILKKDNDIYTILAKNQCYYVYSGNKGSCNGNITKTNKNWTGVIFKPNQQFEMKFSYFCGKLAPKPPKPGFFEQVNTQMSSVGDSLNSSLSRFNANITRKNNSMRENTVPSQGQEDSNTQNSDGSTPSANNDTQKHVVHYVATVHRENQSTLTPKIKEKIDECIKEIPLSLSEREFVNRALCQLSKCDILNDTTADAANTEQTQEATPPDANATTQTQTEATTQEATTSQDATPTDATQPETTQPETTTQTEGTQTDATQTDETTPDATTTQPEATQTDAKQTDDTKKPINPFMLNPDDLNGVKLKRVEPTTTNKKKSIGISEDDLNAKLKNLRSSDSTKPTTKNKKKPIGGVELGISEDTLKGVKLNSFEQTPKNNYSYNNEAVRQQFQNAKDKLKKTKSDTLPPDTLLPPAAYQKNPLHEVRITKTVKPPPTSKHPPPPPPQINTGTKHLFIVNNLNKDKRPDLTKKRIKESTINGGKRMYNKHKYNSRKKRKNKQKSHKKKYNVKYMSKRHSRRRHSRKMRCLNKQSGGIFGAAQYNETLFGSNANEQNQHLLNGALYPSAQGIQTAQTYQGGSRRRRRRIGSSRKKGGSLGFIGANVVVPGALFAGNMIYGNSVKSQLYKRRNNRTYRHRR